MKVKQLHLQNYGRFEDLTIDFAPTDSRKGNVTVIVGNNGAGKSQILQALATGFSWFVNGLLNYDKVTTVSVDKEHGIIQSNEGEFIKLTQIKNGHDHAKVGISLLQFNQTLKSIEINATKSNLISTAIHGTSEDKFHSLIEYYAKLISNNKNTNIPLIAFYSVNRDVNVKSIPASYSFATVQLDTYWNCLNAGAEYLSFFKWFRDNEDVENENKRNQVNENNLNELLEIEININELLQEKHLIEKRLDGAIEEEQVVIFEELKEITEELMEQNQKRSSIIVRGAVIDNFSDYKQIALDSVRHAIEYFTDFKKPRIRRQGTPTMIVEKVGNDGQIEELDVNQLSQGEKSLLALVGDIARRLAILNPSLDDPLQGEGVVMIDEVDLHLHPKWQHDLIDKLVRTFPNVQFILTTHSPHIISDNPDILVYALNDGKLTQVPNIYGEDVNTVLTKVFEVDIRDGKVQQAFDDIYNAIDNKSFTNAEEKLVRLEQELPTSNLELLRARLRLTQAKLAETEALKLESEQ